MTLSGGVRPVQREAEGCSRSGPSGGFPGDEDGPTGVALSKSARA
jgi:hypothetical protein